MAVTAVAYDKFVANQLAGAAKIDFDSASIDCRLLTSAYTPDQAADEFWSTIKADEVATGGGYTAGGQALTNIAVSTASHATKVDADDPVWSASTITARYAAFVVHTGADATDRLIALVDFGQDESSVSADFKITLDADGFVKFASA